MQKQYPYFSIEMYFNSGCRGSFYFQPSMPFLSIHQAQYIFDCITEGEDITGEDEPSELYLKGDYYELNLVYGTIYNKMIFGYENLEDTPYEYKEKVSVCINRTAYLKALLVFENVLRLQADGEDIFTKEALLKSVHDYK